MNAAEPLSSVSHAASDCKSYASADDRLEAQIDAAHDRLTTALTRESRFAAWNELAGLHAQRSVNLVRFMERIQGIA